MRSKEILNRMKDWSWWRKAILLIVSAGVCVVCYFINGDTNVRLIQFSNPLFYVIGATAGCLMMIVFSMMICDLQLSKHKAFQYMLYIGRGTLIILYVHRLYIGIIKVFLIPKFPFLNQNIVIVLLTLVFFVIFAYPSCIVVNKYLPLIIGKKYKIASV